MHPGRVLRRCCVRVQNLHYWLEKQGLQPSSEHRPLETGSRLVRLQNSL